MFSGIVECLGEIVQKETKGTNTTFQIRAPFTNELKVDQSIAHNGVCLTVEQIENQTFQVTAVETLQKTNLGSLKKGDLLNLERCLRLDSLIDGHLVQGHVDTIAVLEAIRDRDGSHVCRFSYPSNFAHLLVEKGSVCINGTSLTVFDLQKDAFSVTLIPYTWEHTNFHRLQKGDKVNIEFDMVGKYIARKLELG